MLNKNTLLGLAMVISALIAYTLIPEIRVSNSKANLGKIIPVHFGYWEEDKTTVIPHVNPQVTASLNMIYTDLLSKSYINRKTGRKIMLSIAYGKDQRSDMAVHYPEVCYPAQGFEVISSELSQLKVIDRVIPIRRLETRLNERYEPITYWITIGEYVTLTGFDRRMKELKYGLKGIVPDGLLFRVSSINKNSAEAFEDQEDFVAGLFHSISLENRNRLAGNIKPYT